MERRSLCIRVHVTLFFHKEFSQCYFPKTSSSLIPTASGEGLLYFEHVAFGTYVSFFVFGVTLGLDPSRTCNLMSYITEFYSNIPICNKIQSYTVYFIWKLLYMFRVVPPPIIRSANNCIYSIWYLSHRY